MRIFICAPVALLCALSGCDLGFKFDLGGSPGAGPSGLGSSAPKPSGCSASGGDPRTKEPIVTRASGPPPLSGGTLLVTRDGHTAVAADPDRDLVHLVDLSSGLVHAVALTAGDEPGRLVEDGAGRRTQSLRGGVLALAPFHWDGSLPDFPSLFDEVFVRRMGGPPLRSDQIGAMSAWVDRVPLLEHAPSADAAAVARGSDLFHGGAACVACHAGARMTNNLNVDVGTGGGFQVPSLRGVAFRAPYLHDGRAATLADRFTALGGGDQHGHTSDLSPSEIADLVAYLETL
jgi:mono/diheme cytochrome c family protein